uniref:Uncharacterized protein n=1 Tax=Anguilla anguilla TaxID=7936 RepID=A0A0E9VH34_ANGAN
MHPRRPPGFCPHLGRQRFVIIPTETDHNGHITGKLTVV